MPSCKSEDVVEPEQGDQQNTRPKRPRQRKRPPRSLPQQQHQHEQSNNRTPRTPAEDAAITRHQQHQQEHQQHQQHQHQQEQQPLDGSSPAKEKKRIRRKRNRKQAKDKQASSLHDPHEGRHPEEHAHILSNPSEPQMTCPETTDPHQHMVSAESSPGLRESKVSLNNSAALPSNLTSSTASTSDPHLRHQTAPKHRLLPKIYDAYYSPELVQEHLDSGTVLRGVLRVNPKNPVDAYVSLDESPSERCLYNYPQLKGYDVGSSDDIYICGEVSRNRAISGDAVAVRILSKRDARITYKINRLASDRRIDNLKECRRHRLEKMAADAATSLSSNENGSSDMSGDRKVSMTEEGRVFGAVVAIISHNSDRTFTGRISLTPPKLTTRSRRDFVDSLGTSSAWFRPLDGALPCMVIPRHGIPQALLGESKQRFCTVKMNSWKVRDPFPSGVFVKDLGRRGTLDIETQIILEENGVCNDSFTPSVLKCLPSSPWTIPSKEIQHRTDLRKSCIFTIDPPTARDLDDAVSCTRLPNGNMLVGVHIADVSYFVRPNTALDIQARQRATTTYMVQRAYPMLPSMLCEDLCSLNPGVDRLAFSVMWEMDPETATVQSTWFGRTVISSACKLAYDDAQHVIDGNHLPDSIQCFEFSKKGAVAARPSRRAQVEESILWFYKLSKIMRQRRFDNGALSLSSVKLSFELNEAGEPIDCWPYAIKDSNRLIEEFMLLANMSVAARIEATFPDASLLRRHSPPLSRRLDEVCKQLEASGIHLSSASAGELQESLGQVDDPDVRFTVEEILTGPMQRALYFSTHSIKDKDGYRHYALNVPLYTHFTSPIRRYADIIVHRTLEASLALFGNHVVGDHPLLPQYFSPFFPGTPAEGSLTESADAAKSLLVPKPRTIAEIAHQCNLRKDAAKKAQEASAKLYLVHYLTSMSKKVAVPGVVSLGVVTKITQEKFVVSLPAFGIDGTIYMDRLADRKNQVLSIDSRNWKLRLWTVEAASVMLSWEAEAPKHAEQAEESSRSDPVADLADELSILVIDDNGHGTVHFGRKQTTEHVSQKIQIFSKVAVCVLPNKSPPDLSVKLVMPSIYS
ncbi:hypothetical protein LPJ72_001474 [Coemansia sp. Benny D160-2]|nr:hypothetical protein LPJ72_001474 [Coemansia sp. Benny D160-2]